MGRKYKCKYCDYKGEKEDLIHHIEDNHESMIPEGFTAGRVVFNIINNKTHGVCVVCKRETEWNEGRLKYNRLCNRKECKEALRKMYSENMIKVHGTDNILTDMAQQEKMLRNRRISGKYRFSDGGFHIFTGSYEKKCMEFLDKVLGYKSSEILSPGPVLEYEYNGQKLQWITDIFIIPYNLIIEVKDGGDNKNNREMVSYREKQVAKENMITNLGKYNYLRLTNNNFEQLLKILAKLKMQMIDDTEENKKMVIDIHEETSMLEAVSTDWKSFKKSKEVYKLPDGNICEFIYSPINNTWNSIIHKGNNIIRVRSEVLIVNDNGKVLCQYKPGWSDTLDYATPAGSMEPGLDLETCAKKECQEELRVTPKNMKYEGVYWNDFDKYWIDFNIKKNGIPYTGSVTYTFSAEYDKKFNGYVAVKDRNDEMAKDAEWIDILSLNHPKIHEDVVKNKIR